MKNTIIENVFNKEVKNKFDVYNSLFLNLPYPKVSSIGMLIPLLHQVCKNGLDKGEVPIDIIDSFLLLTHKLRRKKIKLILCLE